MSFSKISRDFSALGANILAFSLISAFFAKINIAFFNIFCYNMHWNCRMGYSPPKKQGQPCHSPNIFLLKGVFMRNGKEANRTQRYQQVV